MVSTNLLVLHFEFSIVCESAEGSLQENGLNSTTCSILASNLSSCWPHGFVMQDFDVKYRI